jgi:hypothetical protein
VNAGKAICVTRHFKAERGDSSMSPLSAVCARSSTG